MESVLKRSHTAAFAGNYVMRSEQRRSYTPPAPKPESPKKPPKKRPEKTKRTQAGFIYKFFTVLVGIIFWPAGLIMLLQKYLHWKPFTKFLTACITLALAIFLYGFLLTVNTGIEQYTHFQDIANARIELIASDLSDFAVKASDKLVEAGDGIDNFVRAAIDIGSIRLADGIDYGVDLSYKARDKIAEWTGNTGISEPEASETPEPEATSEPVSETFLIEPPEVNNSTIYLPVRLPETQDPAEGMPIEIGSDPHSGITAERINSESEPESSPLTAEPGSILSFPVKDPADATVYFNHGSGRYYHRSTSCGSMKSADTHTLMEAKEAGVEPCTRCVPPSKDLLDEAYIAWIDQTGTAHLSDTCGSFSGNADLMSAAEAIEKELPGCDECGSSGYLAAIARGDTVNSVPAEQFS